MNSSLVLKQLLVAVIALLLAQAAKVGRPDNPATKTGIGADDGVAAEGCEVLASGTETICEGAANASVVKG
jgi:hypothetical protein